MADQDIDARIAALTAELEQLRSQKASQEAKSGSDTAQPSAPAQKSRTSFTSPNFEPRRSVTVRVPATTANMGPGYDCLGMALDMWSEITVTRPDDGTFQMTIEGQGEAEIPRDETNLVVIACKAAFEAAGFPFVPLHYHCINRIPFGRGLGSSSAAIVGGLIAGLAMCGHRLSVLGNDSLMRGGGNVEPEELLQLASGIEGHPDNVCPAIYGGIQLGIDIGGGHWRSARVPCPPMMQLVAFISDKVGKTSELRAVLKPTITREEAVFNIGRVAFLINSLSQNKMYDLRYATQDALHQPQRAKAVYTHLEPLIEAGLAAGAHGVYLSGAGPTVLAITSGAAGDIFAQSESERVELAVANAMLAAAEANGHTGNVYITHPVARGAYIAAADPPFGGQQGLIKYPGNL